MSGADHGGLPAGAALCDPAAAALVPRGRAQGLQRRLPAQPCQIRHRRVNCWRLLIPGVGYNENLVSTHLKEIVDMKICQIEIWFHQFSYDFFNSIMTVDSNLKSSFKYNIPNYDDWSWKNGNPNYINSKLSHQF